MGFLFLEQENQVRSVVETTCILVIKILWNQYAQKSSIGFFHTTCQSKEVACSVMGSHLLKRSEHLQDFVGMGCFCTLERALKRLEDGQ